MDKMGYSIREKTINTNNTENKVVMKQPKKLIDLIKLNTS